MPIGPSLLVLFGLWRSIDNACEEEQEYRRERTRRDQYKREKEKKTDIEGKKEAQTIERRRTKKKTFDKQIYT